MIAEIGTWREPVKRGKRVFDDKEFADSLKSQFKRRKSLTPRQVTALKKLLASYHEQIADFENRAKEFGISVSTEGTRRRKGGGSRR